MICISVVTIINNVISCVRIALRGTLMVTDIL